MLHKSNIILSLAPHALHKFPESLVAVPDLLFCYYVEY
jgi:hypothetical protein